MKTTEKIFDIQTGETTIVERDLTAEEIAKMEAAEAEVAQIAQLEAEKEAARQAVLAKLGLTPEEAQALLS
jgi:phosphopantetheinyl transferase (holo-ACP synthase)